MKSYQKKAISQNTVYMVKKLAEDQHISQSEALEKILSTNVYSAMQDQELELYGESRECLYKVLCDELAGNKSAVKELFQ